LRMYEEICDKLGDSLWQRDINLLTSHSNYINSYYAFVLTTYVECNEIERDIKGIENNIQSKSMEYEALQNNREKERLQELEMEHHDRYAPLIDILSSEDLGLVNAFVVTAGTEQDQILSLVIRILDAYKKTMPIIHLTITKEVEGTTDATTLFRGNTCATKLMSQFVKMTGGNFFAETVNSHILEVIKEPIGYEVDPDKISPGEDVIKNMQKLISTTKRFLDSIIDSFNNSFPLAFRLISNHLRAEVEKKFPQSKYTAIGGFVFLRFFCPGIMFPDSQGLIEGEVDANSRRALTLISKSLQNLSNGIEFGKKEAYMEEMNTFIRQNLPVVHDFFDKVSTLPNNIDYPPLSSLDTVIETLAPQLHEKLIQNLEKISSSLYTYKHNYIIPDLVHVLGNLGEIGVEIEQVQKKKKDKS